MTLHLLAEHPLPGLDPARLARLAEAGLSTVEQLVEAGPERLASLTGFDSKTCRALVRLAESALDRPTAILPFVSPGDEGVRSTRGLDAARRIERTLGIVRQTLAAVSVPPADRKWKKRRRKARKQLSRLNDDLANLQRSLLGDGLTHRAEDHLRMVLDRLERRLLTTMDLPADAHFYRRARRVARKARALLYT